MRLFAAAPRSKDAFAPLLHPRESAAPWAFARRGAPARAIALSLFALVSLACGAPDAAGPTGEAASSGHETTAPPAPLDWARLLPFNTQGLLRIDMAQLRRSSHYALIRPALNELLQEEAGGDAAAWEAMLTRTDVVLVGITPGSEASGDSEATILLARGSYPPDQIEQLQPADTTDERVDVDGVRVWVEPVGERPALALLRGDTIVSGPLREVRGLLARTRMTEGERWPPAVRPLVSAMDLERSTIALVVTEQALDVPLPIQLSAQAALDDRLVLEARLLMNDESPGAPMMRLLIETMVQRLAEQARSSGHPTLGRIDSLLQVGEEDGALVGRLETDAPTTAALIREILETFGESEDAAAEEAAPNPAWPTPTDPPLPPPG